MLSMYVCIDHHSKHNWVKFGAAYFVALNIDLVFVNIPGEDKTFLKSQDFRGGKNELRQLLVSFLETEEIMIRYQYIVHLSLLPTEW